jgi:hypothetical protein
MMQKLQTTMQKLLLGALMVVIPSVASAQVGYVEGAIGLALIPDVETDDYSFTLPGGGLFQGNAEASYKAEFSVGAEAGLTAGSWRFGASWDFISAQLDAARLEGTLDGASFSEEVADDELEDFGLSGESNINIFAANAYYNLGGLTGVQPYVGLGAGIATFESGSTEFAALLTLGALVPLGRATYLSGRYRFAYLTEPDTDNEINFRGLTLHTFSLILGFYFG